MLLLRCPGLLATLAGGRFRRRVAWFTDSIGLSLIMKCQREFERLRGLLIKVTRVFETSESAVQGLKFLDCRVVSVLLLLQFVGVDFLQVRDHRRESLLDLVELMLVLLL